MQETYDQQSPPAAAGSWLLLTVILAVWQWALPALAYTSAWTAQQIAISIGQELPRVVHVYVVAGHGLAVLIPALIAAAVARDRRYRAIFRAWALAAVFALVLAPAHLTAVTDAQTTAVLQIGLALIYIGVLVLLARRRGRPSDERAGTLALAVAAAAIIVWPWPLWGALGSWLDTLLNLAAALLLGLAAGLTLRHDLLPALQETLPNRRSDVLVGGLAASAMLATMGAAFGANGQQLILLALLPSIGWALLGVVIASGPALAPGWRAAALFTGLVAAGPLLFVDPDELLLILNLGTRDVAAYATYATLAGMACALLLGLLAVVLANRLRPASQRGWPVALAAVAVAGVAAVYALLGQPGWHGERLFVILSDQPDVLTAADIGDYAARRAAAYETLTAHADATQSSLREALDGFGIDYTPYYLVNALEVDGGPFVRLWLETRPEVDRVLDNPELRPLPEPPPTAAGNLPAPAAPPPNLAAINAPAVWESGVTGEGIVVGLSDSGADANHPELRDGYRGNTAAGPAGDAYNWLDPWYGTASPRDWGGHGTHTLGIALGRSVGVAPGAEWIGCVNLARNLANPARYLDCLQFMLAPYPPGGNPLVDGRPDLGAHVLNNSWSCPDIEGCDPLALEPAVGALRAAGVFVVAAAGNDGPTCGTVNDPIGLYDEVFSVGAVGPDGQVTPFSSRGPVTADGSERVKPDVVAPGEDILSAYPGGGYATNSGTSMAAPHVVGVVALLWSANPALIGDIAATEAILTATARPVTPPSDEAACGRPGETPNNVAGYGLVDALEAIERALAEP